MSGECEITIKVSAKELEYILKCIDIAKDEFGPFPSRHICHKLYKKLKQQQEDPNVR